MYAQTNVQLFSQLQREGYTAADQRLIHDAYQGAIEVFTGYFTAIGRTQIAHVVGTASILGSLHVPAEVIAAALLHNAYDTGDFGDGRLGISDAKRRRVRQAVGARVEEYVHRFPAMKHATHAAAARSQQAAAFDALEPVDRSVQLIVLADSLEHRLNGEDGSRSGAFLAERAECLGFPALAAEIRRVFSQPIAGRFDVELASPRGRSGVIAPRSYRPKAWVALVRRLRDVRRGDGLRERLGRIAQEIPRRLFAAGRR